MHDVNKGRERERLHLTYFALVRIVDCGHSHVSEHKPIDSCRIVPAER